MRSLLAEQALCLFLIPECFATKSRVQDVGLWEGVAAGLGLGRGCGGDTFPSAHPSIHPYVCPHVHPGVHPNHVPCCGVHRLLDCAANETFSAACNYFPG